MKRQKKPQKNPKYLKQQGKAYHVLGVGVSFALKLVASNIDALSGFIATKLSDESHLGDINMGIRTLDFRFLGIHSLVKRRIIARTI